MGPHRYVAFAVGFLISACGSSAPTSAERGPSEGDVPAAPSLPVPSSSSPPSSPPGESTPASSGDATPPAPGAGCAGKTGRAGELDLTIVSSGIERHSQVHVPPSYDGTRALPVVLVLHPLLLQSPGMRAIASVEKYAADRDHGFIALFPDGIERSWNAGECCGEAKDRKLDDVRFIGDLLARVATDHCVDRARVYAMGYSNGGFLAHRLACELPGGVRAIAPVAGTLGIPEAACNPGRTVPVLAVHGTEDELVPYAGGSPKIPFGSSFGTFVSPAKTDAFWSKANGCGPAGAPYFTNGDVSCVRHTGCRDGATVGLCTVTGGGHQWPGGPALPAMGHRTMNLDATAAAVAFFREHGL